MSTPPHSPSVQQPVSAAPLRGIPLVRAGDDLVSIIGDALVGNGITPAAGDIVCLAQKIVSKAEDRLVDLRSVTPSAEAVQLARETDKDPRLVQLILDESTTVVRKKPGVLLVRHRLGIVGAQAGIDQSNVEHGPGGTEDERALLLPVDPDRSAALLRAGLEARFGVRLGVIITDSNNRPWRLGSIGSAIGCSGIRVLDDRRGQTDLFGRELKVTLINRADALATLATLVMGESTEMTPAAIIRGLPPDTADEPARNAIRPLEEDMFR
ncbi:MAG TPA: coenzyme F420-0:L-glutamate ligase [Gammaproteobacteria bacterium]|nr:coenzyme F420-0:L-glutamate ligase [Gammaproteobacteria bacterium]